MKTIFTTDQKFDTPYMFLKAQRPIVGNVEIDLTDAFYAAIDFNLEYADSCFECCDKLDAHVLLYVSNEDFDKLALVNTPYQSKYDMMTTEQKSKAMVGLRNRIQNIEYSKALELLKIIK